MFFFVLQQAASKGIYADEGFQQLFRELGAYLSQTALSFPFSLPPSFLRTYSRTTPSHWLTLSSPPRTPTARAVTAESQDILDRAQQAMGIISDPVKRQQLEAALASLNGADEHFARVADLLAPVASDAACKSTIEKTGMW